MVILGWGKSDGFSKSWFFFFLLCLCDFDGERNRSGEYLFLCFSFLLFLLALYVAMSEDRLASVFSILLSMVLLSRSLSRSEEKERLCADVAAATFVDAFEFSLWESFGLSATMGVIDIRGVLVKAGDVKLRRCCFLWSSEVDTWSRFFLFFFSLFIVISGSKASFSLLNS